MAFPSEELCPISDDELGRLYRSSPEGLDALVQSVSPGIRALLAHYCSRRAHLFSLGLTIAKTCTMSPGAPVGFCLLVLKLPRLPSQ